MHSPRGVLGPEHRGKVHSECSILVVLQWGVEYRHRPRYYSSTSPDILENAATSRPKDIRHVYLWTGFRVCSQILKLLAAETHC